MLTLEAEGLLDLAEDADASIGDLHMHIMPLAFDLYGDPLGP